VAFARRRAAVGEGRQEAVGRAGRARPGAGLVRVADTRRRTADGAGVPRRMLAVVAAAVALVAAARVAVVGARRARRALRVGRAVRPAAGAVLRRVAFACRPAADGGGRLEHVGRARAAHTRAGLRQVAGAGRRTAGRPRVPRRVLAGVARAVARVGGARGAVVGAGRAGTAAEVIGVGVANGAAAERGRGLEGVGGAGAAAARARLGRVADAGRRPADGPRVARVVNARRRAASTVALVGRAHVAVVRACRPCRLDDVGRAARARAGAQVLDVALVRRRPADRPRVARRVLAGHASAVALVERAGIRVRGARRAVRLLRVGGTDLADDAGAVLREVAFARRAPA